MLNNLKQCRFYSMMLSVGLIFNLMLLSPSQAQESVSTYQANTTKDIYIPLHELEFSLTPLTLEESEIEANAWTTVLKKHITLVSEAEILLSREQSHIQAAASIRDISEDRADDLKDKQQSAAHKKQLEKDYQTLLDQVDKLSDDDVQKAKARDIITQGGVDEKSSMAVAKKAEEYSIVLIKRRELLISNLALLREGKNDILERYHLVLDNWKAKGGDPSILVLYADAISGTSVDLTDSTTAWLTITGWLESKDGGILWLTNLIKFVVSVLVVYFLSRAAGKLTDAALSHNENLSALLKDFIKISVRRVILSIGFIVSLTFININVAPLLALIGAAGLVVGLALQGTLSNFASGMLILIYRPFDIGDVIEIDGNVGFVNSMTLLSTMIKTYDNKHLIVPNNTVWGTTITNITGSLTRRVDLVFGIGYSDDIEKARQIMAEALEQHPLILNKPDYIIKVHELGDSSVNFICRPWVKTKDYWDVYWDIILEVKKQFDLQGISIPFPQRDVHMYNPKIGGE